MTGNFYKLSRGNFPKFIIKFPEIFGNVAKSQRCSYIMVRGVTQTVSTFYQSPACDLVLRSPTVIGNVTGYHSLVSIDGLHGGSKKSAVDFKRICQYKKLSYRRGTARCVVSIEILPIATQQCRNYLYDKS